MNRYLVFLLFSFLILGKLPTIHIASFLFSQNPTTTQLGLGCTLISNLYYCVQINFGSASSTSPSAIPSPTSTTPTTTSTGNGISTPTPYQTGMASNCNGFHLVVSGDQCGIIAADYGISLSQFYAWNPAVGTSCSYLDLGDYVCISVIGQKPTTTFVTSTTTTTPGNGISTPTPYQTGMASNCDAFHLVVSGDQCGIIASQYGISLENFYAWNPAVGNSCQYLDLGDYVCVGTTGNAPSPTTTTPGNGIPTPTPYQTGMTTNCDSFHLVVSGDQCGILAYDYHISLDQFYSWNPAVGSSCRYLDLGYYVCVGV